MHQWTLDLGLLKAMPRKRWPDMCCFITGKTSSLKENLKSLCAVDVCPGYWRGVCTYPIVYNARNAAIAHLPGLRERSVFNVQSAGQKRRVSSTACTAGRNCSFRTRRTRFQGPCGLHLYTGRCELFPIFAVRIGTWLLIQTATALSLAGDYST